MKTNKEFLFSSWAIDHKTVIYVIMGIFLILGVNSYISMPRENFPEINDTKVFVSTVFPGNTAEDTERLVTAPLEEALKGVSNLVDITSTSSEDFSIITIEFDENVSIEEAKQKSKDLVDGVKASADWPTFNNAKLEPNVFEMDFSELLPILNISLIGDYPIKQLKEYAERIEAEVERLPQVKEVNIRGIQDFEVEVALDVYKMTASKISFNDVIGSISNENNTISAGNMVSDGQRRNLRLIGEIKSPQELKEFVIKTENGPVYLGDIATISFKEKETTSFARSFGNKAVLLDVVKRGGKNLVIASQEINAILKNKDQLGLPNDLAITVSNDMSSLTLNQVSELVNNIIFGVILVVTVLMFFLGFRNALFVGFAIPMSMFMSFMILSTLGFTMNTMVLFGLVMGLGMLVDNGIVVVENVYRLMEKEGVSRIQAAKKGIGEIAFPIIISTATTIGAFVPLGAWPGLMGEFMIYFPITLSVVLGSSLIVAVFFNSMLVSQFMEVNERDISTKSLWRLTAILGILGLILIFNRGTLKAIGTIMLVTPLLFWSYKFAIKKWAQKFQNIILASLEYKYRKFLAYALKGFRPVLFLVGTFFLLFTSFALMGVFPPQVEFFPNNDPAQIIIYVEYPEGTDIEKTNATTKRIEAEVNKVIQQPKYNEKGSNFMIESYVAQVGEGAGNPEIDNGNTNELPHKGKITLSMSQYKFRQGASSEILRMEIQKQLLGKFPGVAVSVEKDAAGPPAGYPITIEIMGEDYVELIGVAKNMKELLNKINIAGVEELKIDVNKNKPGVQLNLDRKKAGELGVNASQIGQQLRTSLFGTKAGVFKSNGEDYDINVRLEKEMRNNNNSLFNQNIVFRDPSNGRIKEIPVAALIKEENTTSYSAIKHRKLNRVVTLYSSVLAGFNANEVVDQVKMSLANFELPLNVRFQFSGEIEEQEKNMSFLSNALAAALGLILLLLVFQFNSISKPLIILLSIFLSFTGVFLGLILFQMPFVILMTMMGIISLSGIVVNNGVVLLDYTQLLIDRRAEKQELKSNQLLPKSEVNKAIVEGGAARLRPVILTAITTVLGLIPLAVGLNIDFFTLVTEWSPNIYLGGENVIFWGPLAWTVIFGLTFATFLTLVIVPATFSIVYSMKAQLKGLW
tara:strand:- start:9127 stop:12555 length:3429 start_codon:yes stop_codon:yes gene_type:complete